MRIIVVTRQVPDSNAVIKVKPDGSGIELTGVKLVMDPFDEFGIEKAVRLKESRKDVEEVVALCVGPAKAAETLRTALAIGADRAIHVEDPAVEVPNELFTAAVMAAAIKKDPKGFDLILVGKQAIDWDAGQTGPALAEYLGLPHVGAVTNLEVSEDGKNVKANRRIEGAEEIVECRLPAVITCEKGLNEVRYPTLPNLMKAKKKPMDKLAAADLPDLDMGGKTSTELVKMSPLPERPPCKMLEGEPADMARELVSLLREEAKVV
ncbi:MAG: electron transfer flavoprotein subunit beta/FixA family protein [Phycisphaerales bacterium]|nr:MAG: electron transfer flavoprotein subunit beta/FixA family protein [Phycisphaerales bacterium]